MLRIFKSLISFSLEFEKSQLILLSVILELFINFPFNELFESLFSMLNCLLFSEFNELSLLLLPIITFFTNSEEILYKLTFLLFK